MNVLTRKRYDALVERFGDLDRAIGSVDETLLRELGCREDTTLGALNRLEELDPAVYEKELQRRDLQVLSLEDDLYPALLKTIPDMPVFLYWRGDLAILRQPCVALVGARDMSDYGRRAVAEFVPPLVAAGMVTVSGLAYGVDAEVANETVRAGGKTVAVLGHGLAEIHPRENATLAKKIVEGGGLILSEYPLDAPGDKYTFPARNRIIAGVSLGTIIIQAAAKSGSFITAQLALEYNRDIFAVPGEIFDERHTGCHALIARGSAKLVTQAADVLQELGMHQPPQAQSSLFVAESEQEQAIFDTLTAMPQPLDDLVVRTKLDAAVVNATLTVLELKGNVQNVGGGRWVRR